MASQHVLAAREAGFSIAAIASRPESDEVDRFALVHGIENVFYDPWRMIESPGWDALVVAVPPDVALPYALAGVGTGRWVLAEKPLAVDPAPLRDAADCCDRLVVGYNRRFYSTVSELKSFLDGGGPCLVQVSIPESTPLNAEGQPNMSNVLTNSVHMLDLTNYLLGETDSAVSSRVPSQELCSSVVTVKQTANGHLCTQVFSWNAPANFSVTVDRGDERLVLLPIEAIKRYRGMEVGASPHGSALRMYQPRLAAESWLGPSPGNIKPGLVEQATEFIQLVTGQLQTPMRLATTVDALRALSEAEAILAVAQGG